MDGLPLSSGGAETISPRQWLKWLQTMRVAKQFLDGLGFRSHPINCRGASRYTSDD
jgi:hypothetical protein